MAYKKELSTHCRRCSVEWNDDLSNKYPKRAVCITCHKEEYAERKEKYKSVEYKRGLNRFEKYKPYKVAARAHIHREVNQKIRGLKDRTEIREFLRKRFDELLEDKGLWDYLNDKDNLETQNT